MPTEHINPRQLAVAVAFLVGGLVLGMAARALLRRVAARDGDLRSQRMRRVVVAALERASLSWLAAAGAYGAVLVLPLAARARSLLTDVLLVLVIVAGTLAVARIAGGLVRVYAARGEHLPGSSSILSNVARLIVLVLGGLVVLQTMGVSIAPLLTALGVGGLAVALALQDTLSNLFAGLQILASKKVVPGDYVQLDSGEEGYVVDINWRNTSLRHIRNNVILVPNGRLASAIVTNYYKPFPEMSVLVEVGVSYGSDLAKVERVTTDVARETLWEVEGGVPDFDPFIRYGAFGDSSIDFTVILRVSEPTARYLVTHEFVKRLHERYRREGIEIPFPIRTIVHADGAKWAGAHLPVAEPAGERDGLAGR